MAVYTSYEIKPQYYTGAVAGCINGGEDCRTVAKNSTEEDINLMVDPQMSGISDACKLTSVKMTCQYRVTNTSNGSGLTLKGAFYWMPFILSNPVISGNSLTANGNVPAGSTHSLHGVTGFLTIDSERKGNTDYASYSYQTSGSVSGFYRTNRLVGGHFALKSLNSSVSCRMWLKNVTFTITRTRACYIFWTTGIEGNESAVSTHDYGTVPVYNGNLSKPGYVFKGWKAKDGTLYTGSLPTAGETDVSYEAVWELDKVYVLYDSIFNFRKWADTNLRSWTLMNVTNVTDVGFTGQALADDAYTEECRPLIPVQIGKEYTIEFDASGGGFECFVFNCDANGAWGSSNPMFTMQGNTKKFNFVPVTNYVSIRCDIVGTGTVVNFSNFRIYPADCPYMSNTIAALERADCNTWSMPTPTRDGYIFKGWNTKPDGTGVTYTSNSAFPTSDLILYSQWEQQISKTICDMVRPSKVLLDTNAVKAILIDTTKVYG